MFALFNTQDSQFTISTSITTNQYDQSKEIEEYNLNVIGYLDDTTWFSRDIKTLENNLNIANEFYQMANIVINVDKYEIISNNSNLPAITMMINQVPLTIPVFSSKKLSSQILGLYINGHNSVKPTMDKIRNHIGTICRCLRNKIITHDHVIYIISKILFPKIEYILQFQHIVTN